MKDRWRVISCVLLTLFSAFSIQLSSKVVTLERATKMAETFWNHQLTRSAQSGIRFAWDSRSISGETRTGENQEALFYVFESPSGQGFVIVSAEDAVMPILAYSFKNKAPSQQNLPEPMMDWIESVIGQIRFIRENNVANPNATQAWTRASVGNVVIELETAKWDQGTPYNNQCPMDGNERSVTGCTSTAAAIVMKYYQWPEHGTGTTEAYITDTKKISVEARDLNHAYDWNKMPMTYDSYTGEEAEAISTLMADIGRAFQADYASDGTAAYLQTVKLCQHFGYNPGASYVGRENYSDQVWLQMIKDELLARHLVPYRGAGDTENHMFILDGFTDNDYFHVNWGWGGNANGYFTLSTLAPSSLYSFNDSQWGCFNLTPNTSSSTEVQDWIKFRAPGIVVTETNFAQHSSFDIEVHFQNYSAAVFTGVFRGAITDREGKRKEWITNELTPNKMESNWWFWWSGVRAIITQSIDFGDRIRFFYKPSGSDQWHLVKSSNEIGCQWEVLVADEYSIAESTSFAFDKKNKVITLQTKEGVSAKLLTSANAEVTDRLSEKDNTIEIDMKGLPLDVYIIRLRKGKEEKNIEFSIKSIQESL